MKTIDRSVCEVSGLADLEHLYTFPNFPVFMGCLENQETIEIRQDMSWWIGRQSGLIQLKSLIPLDILYPESHGAGAVGALWTRHHIEFAEFLHKYEPKSVLEIGGAHGRLALAYQDFASIPWSILEPNPSPVEGCRAKFIKRFFDDKFIVDGFVDTIVHSHLFEHIYHPDKFVEHLSRFLTSGKKLIFSLPNMQVMLERNYTNCINFEHTIFLTEPYIDWLLKKHGFRIVEKSYFLEDHSIFYSTIRDSLESKEEIFSGLYEKNKNLYLSYIDYHERLTTQLNESLQSLHTPVYLFGAHVFAQYLIAFGLNTERIVGLLDNDSKKQGRRLYGTNLMVQSPRVLQGISNPVVILKAGVYNSEIKRDILTNINPQCVFLE